MIWKRKEWLWQSSRQCQEVVHMLSILSLTAHQILKKTQKSKVDHNLFSASRYTQMRHQFSILAAEIVLYVVRTHSVPRWESTCCKTVQRRTRCGLEQRPRKVVGFWWILCCKRVLEYSFHLHQSTCTSGNVKFGTNCLIFQVVLGVFVGALFLTNHSLSRLCQSLPWSKERPRVLLTTSKHLRRS